MIRKYLLMLFILIAHYSFGQNAQFEIPQIKSSGEELRIDGLVQPLLDDFISYCKKYNIDYHDNLFNLKEIAVVDTLQVSSKGGTLGMLVRNQNNDVEKIVFSWMTLLDKEILKVVAFHEFGHYFLGYKHVCDDCNIIMAKVNTSYFDIVLDWEYQVEKLFLESPEYLKKKNFIAHITH